MNFKVKMLEGELWYGGSVSKATENPFDKDTVFCYDMNDGQNQTMPLFVSTMGRYIWCDSPMIVNIKNGIICIEADTEIILATAGDCLKDA